MEEENNGCGCLLAVIISVVIILTIIRMMENDGKKDAPINQSMVEQCRQQCVQNGKNKNELALFTVYCVGVYCTICSAKNE